MGLTCSLLGHRFEIEDVERDRREQGSEVVTAVREIERCSRCGTERVVAESTEVTTVIDSEAAGVDDEEPVDATYPEDSGGPVDTAEIIAESTEGTESTDIDGPSDDPIATEAGFGDSESDLEETPDPAAEDAEILTDTNGREPGEWPDEPETADAEPTDDPTPKRDPTDPDLETSVSEAVTPEPDDSSDDTPPSEESMAGITVPEGAITCPECEFTVDAESSYRDGDPCPECGAWLSLERNR
ncbi:MAG: hypothetical protein PPP58_08530 [Natronomonas sp.]